MDLRIVKTKKAIREAFMSLRRELPLSKIKVKAICDMALINKSTFYKYYEDVYDLSDQLEDEFIANIMNLGQVESIFDDPELFLDSMQNTLSENSEEMDILFRDRQHIFMAKANRQLCEGLQGAEQEKAIMATKFVIGGLAFTNFNLSDSNTEKKSDIRDDLISYISAIGNTL